MGLLRLYLALCVIFTHDGVRKNIVPLIIYNGQQAVQIFFVISGFYMALILSEKYRSPVEFYASRFIRIYLPYWTVLGIVIIFSMFSGMVFGEWGELNNYLATNPLDVNGAAGFVLAAVSNITLFFQDWIMFLQHDAGKSLSFITKIQDAQSPLYGYFLIPQAWTIGVELSFYLLAPWVNKLKTRYLILTLLLSLALRYAMGELFGLSTNLWVNRFFPFELALFVSGMLGYRIMKAFPLNLKKLSVRPILNYILAYATVIFIIHSSRQGFALLKFVPESHYSHLILPIGWALFVPLLFQLTKTLSLDRMIGELSYPVYLIHYFVIHSLLYPLFSYYQIDTNNIGYPAVVVSIVLAILLNKYLFERFEKFRYGFAKKAAHINSAETAP